MKGFNENPLKKTLIKTAIKQNKTQQRGPKTQRRGECAPVAIFPPLMSPSSGKRKDFEKKKTVPARERHFLLKFS